MKHIPKLIIGLLIIVSCSTKKKEEKKEILLLANREAPLGWLHLRVYKDSTFEFESSGLRTSTKYKGKALIDKYQIQFNFFDSIPKAGSIAIYDARGQDYGSPITATISLTISGVSKRVFLT